MDIMYRWEFDRHNAIPEDILIERYTDVTEMMWFLEDGVFIKETNCRTNDVMWLWYQEYGSLDGYND